MAGVASTAMAAIAGPPTDKTPKPKDHPNKKPRPSTPNVPPTGTRKLIEFGWDMPGVGALATGLAGMQGMTAFDGLVFNLFENPGAHFVESFDVLAPQQVLTVDDMKLDTLDGLEWGQFTDNFIHTFAYAAAAGGIDWFDDAIWANSASKIALLGKALSASGAKGIFFDPEDYGTQVWRYTPAMFPGRTFEQVCAQVRKRGAQFMTGLQNAKPDVVLVMLLLGFTIRYQTQHAASPAESLYATFPAFVEGVLDVWKAPAVVVDGSEEDYFHDETTMFLRAAQYQRGGSGLIDPALRDKFDAVEMGASVYADSTLGHARAGISDRYAYYSSLTAADVQRWYEHNIYHAMQKAERYAWIYSEDMSFWNPSATFPGAVAGLAASKAKFTSGSALGYDLCRQVDYLNSSTLPACVTSPTVQLSASASGSVPAGTRVQLSCDLGGERPYSVVFYDNSREIETSFLDPWQAHVSVEPGGRTYVARVFREDGTHVTSNPVVITGA